MGKLIDELDGDVDFLSYLRTALLECAGFPGFCAQKKFAPLRNRILKDVDAF